MYVKRISRVFSPSAGAALLVLCLAFCPALALAHSMHVFAYIDGETIKGESAYGDGSPVSGAALEVHDCDGRLVGRAKTSAEGSFSLPLKQGRPPLEVQIKDGGGHACSYTLEPETSSQEASAGVATETSDSTPPDPGPSMAEPAPQEDVALMLRRELAPIKAQLARLASRRTIGLAEVVGGLGWIIGLAGLAMWFKSRKR